MEGRPTATQLDEPGAGREWSMPGLRPPGCGHSRGGKGEGSLKIPQNPELTSREQGRRERERLPLMTGKGASDCKVCDFPGGSDGKRICLQCRGPGFTPWSGRSPGGGKGNPLQYSSL